MPNKCNENVSKKKRLQNRGGGTLDFNTHTVHPCGHARERRSNRHEDTELHVRQFGHAGGALVAKERDEMRVRACPTPHPLTH